MHLVGTGRSADVFAHGAGEVLRRYREPHDTQREVATMEHARAHGYPVPAARVLSDTDIVMERVEGPTMMQSVSRRPWGRFFSMAVSPPSTSIALRLANPTPNMISMSDQQQPTQNAPWAIPIAKASRRSDTPRQRFMTNPSGLRHSSRHRSRSGLNCQSPAASSVTPMISSGCAASHGMASTAA